MPELDDDFENAVKIFRLTQKRTQDKALTWRARSARDGAFETDLAGGNLEVGYADNDSAPPFDFKIFGPGPSLELVYTLSGRRNPELESEIQALHALVERQVKGVENVFQSLLDELGDE